MSTQRPADPSAVVLARIEAGAAAVLAGGPATERRAELARDLAALARTDPLRVTAEVRTLDDVKLAETLGADCVRFDAGALAPRDLVRRCVLVADAHRRAELLEALRGTIAELAAPLVATRLDVVVALGAQPARTLFPAATHRAVDAAIALGLPPGRAAAANRRDVRARRPARRARRALWLAADPELFRAIAGGWADACVAPAVVRVSTPPEIVVAGGKTSMSSLAVAVRINRGNRPPAFVAPAVTSARATSRRSARSSRQAPVSARASRPRAASSRSIRSSAPRTSSSSTSRCSPRPASPCRAPTPRAACRRCSPPACSPATRSPTSIPRSPRSSRPRTAMPARARPAARPRSARALARLDDFAIDGVGVPARDAAAVRLARFRRGAHATAAARAAELDRDRRTRPARDPARTAAAAAGHAPARPAPRRARRRGRPRRPPRRATRCTASRPRSSTRSPARSSTMTGANR